MFKKTIACIGVVATLFLGIYYNEVGNFISEKIGITGTTQKDIDQENIVLDSLTLEEQELIQQLHDGGSTNEQIVEGLIARRKVLKDLEKQNQEDHLFDGLSKQEVLNDAFNNGVTDVHELQKLGALYDLLVTGKTNVDTLEPNSHTIERAPEFTFLKSPPTTDTSFAKKWEHERNQRCQEDIDEYNVCLTEYNIEMVEYNTCLNENSSYAGQFGEGTLSVSTHCSEPYNSCHKPWCMGL